MNLLEIIRNLETFSEDGTIYSAEPWTAESKSIVLQEPDDGALPEEAKRLNAVYFLEIFTAVEIFKNLPDNFTLEQKCARLIQYSINDA